jgi:hypothetical protein
MELFVSHNFPLWACRMSSSVLCTVELASRSSW